MNQGVQAHFAQNCQNGVTADGIECWAGTNPFGGGGVGSTTCTSGAGAGLQNCADGWSNSVDTNDQCQTGVNVGSPCNSGGCN
jgi:hypothetical protein